MRRRLTRPKRIFRREIPGKIEYLEFVTGRGRYLDHFAPAAGDPVQQNEDVTALRLNKAASCRHVRPNHRFHPAFERVEHRERYHDDDASFSDVPRTKPHHQRDCRNADASAIARVIKKCSLTPHFGQIAFRLRRKR